VRIEDKSVQSCKQESCVSNDGSSQTELALGHAKALVKQEETSMQTDNIMTESKSVQSSHQAVAQTTEQCVQTEAVCAMSKAVQSDATTNNHRAAEISVQTEPMLTISQSSTANKLDTKVEELNNLLQNSRLDIDPLHHENKCE